MTQDQTEITAAQQRRRRRGVYAACLAILLMAPVIVVLGFSITTGTMFARMEAQAGSAKGVSARYDAFEHSYASGVMAVLFGDALASLAGHVVELVEQNGCVEREHDLINNRMGRAFALRLYAENPEDWRRRLAEALYDELRRPATEFSVLRTRDPRVLAICNSD